MKRSEPEDDLFEQLWLLRFSYGHRSDYDRVATLTVAETVVYAEQLLRLGRIRGRWTGRTTGFGTEFGTAHRTA
jgi:hypothetical protein